MQFGLSLIMRGPDATPGAFLQLAERAEAGGIDSLWCSSHIVLPPQTKTGFARVPGRKYPDHWNDGYWEPVAVCGYLAGRTQRITLGTSIVVLPMHSPFELAKQVAEVDQLSQGRFVFGIGVGWFEEEFDTLGQNFHNRGARTDDALALMQHLWSDADPVTYEGRYYSVHEGRFAPKPLQRPHPPIWVAGHSEATFRRAGRFGAAWHPRSPTFEYLAEGRAKLARYAQEAGRPTDAVQIAIKLPLVFQDGPPGEGQMPTQGRPQDILDGIRRYRDAGVAHIVFDFLPERLATALDTLERFLQEVRPKL